MIIARGNVRRGVLGILAAAVLAGVSLAIVLLPSAKAEPTPSPEPTATSSPTSTPTSTSSPTTTPAAASGSCNAAKLTTTISSVNNSMSQYFVAHPDVNQALGDIARQSPFQAQGSLKKFFDDNPTAATDIHALQQPLRDLSDQCGFQVTPGQVLIALEDV